MANEIPSTHPYRSDVALKARYDRDPTLGQKIAKGTLALGAVAVLAFGIAKGTRLAAEGIHDAFHGAQVYNELRNPIGEVAAAVKTGDISRADVTTITVDKPQAAWTEAATLAGEDHPAQLLSNIIQAQQGDRLAKGDHVILPTSGIETPIEPPR
jgi:hypothetical protein